MPSLLSYKLASIRRQKAAILAASWKSSNPADLQAPIGAKLAVRAGHFVTRRVVQYISLITNSGHRSFEIKKDSSEVTARTIDKIGSNRARNSALPRSVMDSPFGPVLLTYVTSSV